MADENQSVPISGLERVGVAEINADTSMLPVVVDGTTKKASPRDLTDAMTTTFAGAATGSGKVGATITLTLPNNSIGTGKLALQTANRVIVSDGSGNVIASAVGSGLSLSGGILSASAPAAAAPSTTALTRRFFRGL